MKKTLEEFKAFALKGNVIDLAVGVVIGTAFGKIVSSLVGDVIMPLMGALTAGIDFTELAVQIPSPWNMEKLVDVKYGLFLQTIFDFAIIAFCIFWVVKMLSKAMPKKKEESAPAGPTSEELLTEIRDLLKK